MIKNLNKKWNSLERKVTKNFSKRQKGLWEIFVFLLRFNLLALPLHFFIWLNFNSMPLQEINSILLDKIMSFSSIDYVKDGIYFMINTESGKITAEISKDCVAWKSFLALFGLIFAVRKVKLRKRIYGLLLGLPLIFIGNIIRLYTTFYITAIKGTNIFELVHSFLWQWGLIFLVIGIWYFWLDKIAE